MFLIEGYNEEYNNSSHQQHLHIMVQILFYDFPCLCLITRILPLHTFHTLLSQKESRFLLSISSQFNYNTHNCWFSFLTFLYWSDKFSLLPSFLTWSSQLSLCVSLTYNFFHFYLFPGHSVSTSLSSALQSNPSSSLSQNQRHKSSPNEGKKLPPLRTKSTSDEIEC